MNRLLLALTITLVATACTIYVGTDDDDHPGWQSVDAAQPSPDADGPYWPDAWPLPETDAGYYPDAGWEPGVDAQPLPPGEDAGVPPSDDAACETP